MRRLIGHLHRQESPELPAITVRPDSTLPAHSPWQFDVQAADGLQLSAVVVQPKDTAAAAGPRDLDAVELAERVIAGIRREQRLLELRERRGLLEYVLDMVWR